MNQKLVEKLTPVIIEMQDIVQAGKLADHETVNAWLSVLEEALKPNTKLTRWVAESISVQDGHLMGHFPNLSVSVNLVATERDNDAVIQQEHLAEEIAELISDHTTHKETK